MSKPKHVLKSEGEGDTDLFIERIKDGKRVADVSGTDINPTAPVYYKIMSELEAIVAAGLLDNAAIVAPADPEQVPMEEAVKDKAKFKEVLSGAVPSKAPPVKITYAKDSPMPPINPTFGDRTPEFVEWLTATNPKEAAKRYKGKNVPAYEAAK
jgi:hypothetical protein